MTIIALVIRLGFALALLEALIAGLSLPRYIVPPPSALLYQLWSNWEVLALHGATTAAEAGLGISGALVFGTMISLLSARWVPFHKFIGPSMTAAQSIPVLAFAPIITTWFGPGLASKAVLSLLVCLPVVVITVGEGLQRVPPAELELFRSLKATSWQTIIRLRIPRARPYLIVAAQLAIPLGVLGAIVGEFVGASRGLGFLIMRASYYVRTDEMFTAILIAGAMSIAVVKALSVFTNEAIADLRRRQSPARGVPNV
jgi:ABC-type nitrate/sulfonate/bicarbonate transport system permease component